MSTTQSLTVFPRRGPLLYIALLRFNQNHSEQSVARQIKVGFFNTFFDSWLDAFPDKLLQADILFVYVCKVSLQAKILPSIVPVVMRFFLDDTKNFLGHYFRKSSAFFNCNHR